MSRSPRRSIVFTCVAALLVSSGCGRSGSSGQGGSGPELKTLTVAALPLVDTAGLHIAMAKKLFEAEGLQVKVQPVAQSITALPALRNGQVDVIAGANYVTFLQAYQKGALRLAVLADGSSEAPGFMRVLVLPGSPIRQPKDLEGHTVAVNILNNIQSLTLDEVLRADHVDPSKVVYRAVQFPLMDKTLADHDVDAVHVGEPFGTVFRKELGARVVVDGGSGPVAGLPVSGYVSTQDFVTRYPKTAAAFQRAIEKAQSLASGDRKQVEDVLPSYAKVDGPTAEALALPGYPASLDPVRLQRLADLMLRDGLTTSRIEVKNVLFTPSAP